MLVLSRSWAFYSIDFVLLVCLFVCSVRSFVRFYVYVLLPPADNLNQINYSIIKLSGLLRKIRSRIKLNDGLCPKAVKSLFFFDVVAAAVALFCLTLSFNNDGDVGRNLGGFTASYPSSSFYQ